MVVVEAETVVVPVAAGPAAAVAVAGMAARARELAEAAAIITNTT